MLQIGLIPPKISNRLFTGLELLLIYTVAQEEMILEYINMLLS